MIFPLHLQIMVYTKKLISNHHPVYTHAYSDGQFDASLCLGYSSQRFKHQAKCCRKGILEM